MEQILKKTILAAILTLTTTSVLANSAMVFPQRVILDEQNRTGNFKVVNPKNTNTTYEISLVDRSQQPSGRTIVSDDFEMTAKNNIKYSPRKTIKLSKNGKKPIRVKLSKYSELEDGEYRTYLNIITKPNNKKNEGYAVETRTGIQLPIIIRKGNLKAKLEIQNAVFQNGKVDVTLSKKGNRSVYGTITIKQNNKTIGLIKSTAVYPESETATYSVKTENLNPNHTWKVTFSEADESGNIKASKTF